MTIKEVSQKYGVSADTLRYYERIGVIPAVNRSKSGIRDYSEQDCAWVEFAKCMRDAGVQVEAIIEYVEMYQKGESTYEARLELLIEQRNILIEKMKDMQSSLERLNTKIDNYEKGKFKKC